MLHFPIPPRCLRHHLALFPLADMVDHTTAFLAQVCLCRPVHLSRILVLFDTKFSLSYSGSGATYLHL
jgi:hypothetical protein